MFIQCVIISSYTNSVPYADEKIKLCTEKDVLFMKKENLKTLAVISAVVAAAGTIIAVIAKCKNKKQKLEWEREAAEADPVKEELDESDEESEFTVGESAEPVYVDEEEVAVVPEEPEKKEDIPSSAAAEFIDDEE